MKTERTAGVAAAVVAVDDGVVVVVGIGGWMGRWKSM